MNNKKKNNPPKHYKKSKSRQQAKFRKTPNSSIYKTTKKPLNKNTLCSTNSSFLQILQAIDKVT